METGCYRWAAQMIIRSGVLAAIERIEARRANILRILAYHRIGQPETETGRLDPGLLNASCESFARQMLFLCEHYHIVSVDELLRSLEAERSLPPRSVMVTFDDGYRDFMDTACPVLQDLQIPAILFVATNYLSGHKELFWWDQLYQACSHTECEELCISSIGAWPLRNAAQRDKARTDIEQMVRRMDYYRAMALIEQTLETLGVSPKTDREMLTWHDVRYLSARGLCIGAHTRSHPILAHITLDEARQEIVGSQQDLCRELERTWPVFAYPCGHQFALCPELTAILEEAGFKVAMTLLEGHNVLGRTHPLRLRRVGMAPHISLAEFRLILTRMYDVYGTLGVLAHAVRGANTSILRGRKK